MKFFLIISRILVAGILVFLAVKILYPHSSFRIESFEYFLRSVFHLNWLAIPFLSRILIGILFSLSFLLLFYYQKIKWIKYLAPLALIIPFFINPILPKNLKDATPKKNAVLNEHFSNLINNDDKTIIALLTPSCRHCINAGKKLVTAKKTSKNFPPIILAGVTEEGVKELREILNYEFEYILLGQELFLELSDYQFPKIHFIEHKKLQKVYDGGTFNYAVLNHLSKKD